MCAREILMETMCNSVLGNEEEKKNSIAGKMLALHIADPSVSLWH